MKFQQTMKIFNSLIKIQHSSQNLNYFSLHFAKKKIASAVNHNLNQNWNINE